VLSPRRAVAFLLLLLSLPATGTPQAEPPSGSVRRSVEVRVTNLDVVVTGRDGKRVPGLSAADFEVREDGVLRTITNFSEVGEVEPPVIAVGTAPTPEATSRASDPPGPAVPSPQASPPARPATYLILFVDNLHISSPNRKRVLDEARAFLHRTAEAGVPVLVVLSDRSPRILQKFTTDAALLDRAVAEMELASSAGQRAEMSRRATYSAIDQAMRDRRLQSAQAHASAYAAEQALDVISSLQSLETTLSQLSALDGRKVLVHVSDGLPLAPGADAYQYLRSFGGGGRGVGPNPMGGAEDLSARYTRLSRSASAARVALHMLDATGLAEDGFGRSADTPIGPRGNLDPIAARVNLQSMLSYLAEETGGTAILNQSRVGPPLEEIAQDLSSYYSIGYETPRLDEDSTHRIEVRTRRPGLTARAQRSLRLKSADTRVAEGVAAALVFGRPENPFGVTVELGEPRPKGNQVLLPLRVRIPANRLVLLPDGPGSHGSVIFYFQVRDEDGRVSDLVRQEDVVHGEGEVVHDALLRMRQGRQVISLGVRDGRSGSASYVQKTVLIPGAKK
jgi:VWFA-related protein